MSEKEGDFLKIMRRQLWGGITMMLLAGVVTLTSFYYTAKKDLQYLKDENIALKEDLKQVKTTVYNRETIDLKLDNIKLTTNHISNEVSEIKEMLK